MFLKYALPPNVLQFCGPDETQVLSEKLKQNDTSEELKQLLLQFEGAVPYLRLISIGNRIEDIFDYRVVEAYWLGNDLLKNISDKNLFANIKNRFKNKMKEKDWKWLVSSSVPLAKPHHVFHVFDIYRRAGLIRSGMKTNILETMDKCRIAYGKVKSVDGNNAIIEYEPLVFFEKKLIFGKKAERKALLLDPKIKKGDEVTIHWGHVCDKITKRQKNNLIFWTKYHLDLTNKTI